MDNVIGKTGLLWLVGSSETLKDALAKAVKAHERRLGTKPTHCYMRGAKSRTVENVFIRGRRSVLPGHLFLVHIETSTSPQQTGQIPL